MTTKADFTEDEWTVVRAAPPAAGMMVAMAHSGGTFRESWALAKTYSEARKQHGESALLDELVSDKPEVKRYHSTEEVEEHALASITAALDLLGQKAAPPEEVEGYKSFVLAVADRVAKAHEEEGEPISPEEQAAIEKIASTLGTTAP